MRHVCAILVLLAPAAFAETNSFKLTGEVRYEGHAPMGDWKGTNQTVTGLVQWDRATGLVQGEACVDLSRWNSGNTVRDEHTREMFDTAKFARACYRFQSSAGNLAGTLDLHGVQHELKLPGALRSEKGKMIFDAELTMRLTDWGLTRPRLLGAVVADEVKVQIHGEGLPQ
jgi:polyisoprenoid-binding protein YceI